LLVLVGVAFKPEERCTWQLYRQFWLGDADGDHDHTEQVDACVVFERSPELDEIDPTVVEWTLGDDLDAWFAAVEKLDAFLVPRAVGVALRVDVRHGEI
jgi:hypothetical protein